MMSLVIFSNLYKSNFKGESFIFLYFQIFVHFQIFLYFQIFLSFQVVNINPTLQGRVPSAGRERRAGQVNIS